MTDRQTRSGNQKDDKDADAPDTSNLQEPEGVEDQRKEDLKRAKAETVDADVKVDRREQAFKSSHVGGDPGAVGHPGYYPDQYTDGDVNYGTFCTVSDGPHEGMYGVYIENVSSDDTGKPEVVIVRERNTGRMVSVKYDDLEPASAGDIGRGRP